MNEIVQEQIFQYFTYNHLVPELQEMHGLYLELATKIVQSMPRNAERTVALRRLLESKDACIRAYFSGKE